MLAAQNLPEFLWEYSILHAAYIHNRSYNKFLENITPYQGWFNRKPNVAHLREFGAPVWILLQGQQHNRKMLPRSKHQVYVGYDEGSKSVKFYNAQTKKVLISRNYEMINPPQDPEFPESITIIPDPPDLWHEGEIGGKDMPHEEVDVDEPR
jgi:hypothetical protein